MGHETYKIFDEADDDAAFRHFKKRYFEMATMAMDDDFILAE